MAFISSLLKPAKHERTKTKKGEGGADEHSDVLKKKVDEKKENHKEHEEASSEESECYSDDDSSDEENEPLNENNKTWNSENNEEDEEDQREERERNEEVHKIYTSEEEDVSRRNSAHSQNAEYTKKKTKLSFNKKKVQSYFHKSYDKVSNAIIKTSKSLFKPHHHGDMKSMKDGNVSSSHILQCLENVEQENIDNDSDFSDEDCGNIVRYLDKHINCEEKNEEIIKKFNVFLENNDHPKVLEELQIILDEKSLLLKSLNYFKILSMNYKKQLNKSNNSYDILKSENEQLIENVKMLKKFIVSLDANTGPCSSEADDHRLHSKECSCEFLKEQETQRSEEPREHTNQDNNEDSDHNEDNGGSTERNKEEYESEALEPTSKEEEPIKLHINEEQSNNLEKIFNNRNEYDSIKDIDPKNKDDENTTKDIVVEEKETLINEDIIIRKEVVEETVTST